MTESTSNEITFQDLGLNPAVLNALHDVGYEVPSPIQAHTIPHILAGRDVLGQAQTGTGKTAAFALPLLSRLDLSQAVPQVLVLTPTRELAIQVAEAFQRYAARLTGFHVLPLYGGQDYRGQFQRLAHGTHVVVGTPGRVMDHMRRGTLKLDALACLVLDEADEMLRMGFIDDVEWILDQIPSTRQIALFSATLPPVIRRIAKKHLHNPQEISIKVRTATAETIRQRYWLVNGTHKLDALTRILEAEPFDGMIVFVRTRTATVELAEKLEARGYAAAALSGDISQKLREHTVQRLKGGKLDILVATDVAARGLDVERISHVINYDIPNDTEAYVHRIGRTGRAGRAGDAILFVTPREQRMLRMIEKATRQKITAMSPPSTEAINDQRIARFQQKISDVMAAQDLSFYRELMESYQRHHDVPAIEIAAALAKLVQGNTPLLLSPPPEPKPGVPGRRPFGAPDQFGKSANARNRPPKRNSPARATDRVRYRIEIGRCHGVKPGNILGAIANEAGLDSQYIGRIDIFDRYSTVELPEGMPNAVLRHLQRTRVAGRALALSPLETVTGRDRPRELNNPPLRPTVSRKARAV
ncbi:DEAD/DEAH box helicase [Nitrococcus mobilis]|uniref:ATP-dependent RNA helicase DeaD n=1 Tax=Nitrococcus mobilis Nb-231 TaxID=314278 RepID=A4BVS7_9GAMM|nr:DEAD/DEAH box helicase [Nitrococcus mobilis]EAR20166.1 DEAD/DEAH box helicase-like protein [Nitrococcus mobilis Nb-231]